MLKNKSVWQWLCLLGILSAVFYVLHVVIGGQINLANNYNANDYEHVDFLTVVGAPARPVAGTLLFISRVMSCVCCLALCAVLKGKANSDLINGIKVLAVFRLAAAFQGLLLPAHVQEYGWLDYSYGTAFVWAILLAPLAFAHVILIYAGTSKKDKSSRRLFPAVLLTVYIIAVAIAAIYEMFTSVFSLTGNVFRIGAGAYILLLGLYGFMQKEGEHGQKINLRRPAGAP